MPFPPSAACRFFDLPPVNLQNLPLHLTKNSFASAPTHLCGIALSSVSLQLTAPSAEGAFWFVRLCVLLPTQAGRGGSVSRRDHSHPAKNRVHLTGGTAYAEVRTSNASRSSGRGGLGRGASLREAASPPESPIHIFFGRGPGGGASCKEAASPGVPLSFPLVTLGNL